MEIEGFDDFDIQYQPKFDLESSNWNGHKVEWLFDLCLQLHEKLQRTSLNSSFIRKTVSTLFHSNARAKTETVAMQHRRDTWASAKTVVDFYLGQNQVPSETLAAAGIQAISGRISLNDLIAPDYLTRDIQIVPFALTWDANLAFIELPEGVSWESLQAPIAGTFQSYFPQGIEVLKLGRNWWDCSQFYAIDYVESYLLLISSRYAEVVAAAQAKGLEFAMETAKAATKVAIEASNAVQATAQASNPYAAIEEAKIAQGAAQRAKDIANAAEQESVLAEALAKAKTSAADAEKLKAFEFTSKAIIATEPPPYLRGNLLLKKPRDYYIQEWHKEIVLRSTEAESQSNKAASAAEIPRVI